MDWHKLNQPISTYGNQTLEMMPNMYYVTEDSQEAIVDNP